ncbi:sensor histidine kinase [Mucilaginibacter terrae]|uniref:histidine kinase n=1 Tax=Mucilaginibacter terrae TaxID=1955052 RepID=A0ABU3GUB0_9SPHI|nr:ATP-binding protein [Mucilaginibacter terrae]MDT3403367.1 PAS domain S-box-containing protein [Mucilaginibacter terrae]
MTENAKHLRILNMIEEIEDYAIILLDSNGNIENWNKGAQRIKGYNPHEIIGQNFRIFYTPADQAIKKPETLINIARTKGRAIDEGWRLRKDGTRFWGSITITAIHDKARQVIGFTKVTRDLTDKMLAGEAISQHLDQLKIQNLELEQFVYIASHDLQEPLLTIGNFIEMLKVDYGPVLQDDDAQLYLGFIEDAASRMRNLIKDLLDYSRLGKTKQTEQVDINELLQHLISDLDTRITASGTQINFNNLPTVTGYRTELRQLFQNLITNAIKFGKKEVSPVINISAKQHEAGGWAFTVQDNGIGIEPKYHEKIFLIFQRLHNRDEYPGNGIGLANCKKIAAMHGGDIGVQSAPGTGSSFYFTLNIEGQEKDDKN